MKRLSQIDEGVFSDILKRDNEDAVRKEDMGIIIEWDGEKYHLDRSFMDGCDYFDSYNKQFAWNFLAFNKPQTGNTVIDKDGMVGHDKYDNDNDYDVYVLRKLIGCQTVDDMVKVVMETPNIQLLPSSDIRQVVNAYIRKLFTDNHMTELAQYNIFDFWPSDLGSYDYVYSVYIDCGDLSDVDVGIDEASELSGKEGAAVYIIYPNIDDWKDEFKNAVVSSFQENGWTYIESWEIDPFDGYPKNSGSLCFGKSDEEK